MQHEVQGRRARCNSFARGVRCAHLRSCLPTTHTSTGGRSNQANGCALRTRRALPSCTRGIPLAHDFPSRTPLYTHAPSARTGVTLSNQCTRNTAFCLRVTHHFRVVKLAQQVREDGPVAGPRAAVRLEHALAGAVLLQRQQQVHLPGNTCSCYGGALPDAEQGALHGVFIRQ